MYEILQETKSYCDAVSMIVPQRGPEIKDLSILVPILSECALNVSSTIASQGFVTDWIQLSQALITYCAKVTSLISEMNGYTDYIEKYSSFFSDDTFGAGQIQAALEAIKNHSFDQVCELMTGPKALSCFQSDFGTRLIYLQEIQQILHRNDMAIRANLNPGVFTKFRNAVYIPENERKQLEFCQKYKDSIRSCVVESVSATDSVLKEIGDILKRRSIPQPVLPLPSPSSLPALEDHTQSTGSSLLASASSSSTPPRIFTNQQQNQGGVSPLSSLTSGYIHSTGPSSLASASSSSSSPRIFTNQQQNQGGVNSRTSLTGGYIHSTGPSSLASASSSSSPPHTATNGVTKRTSSEAGLEEVSGKRADRKKSPPPSKP
jgi:glutaredoxin